MRKITFAKGDGIGPDFLEATLKILKAAKVPIQMSENTKRPKI